jgi:hypothetical protein
MTRHVLNKFQQKVVYYVGTSTSLLILFGIRKNCHSSGRNMLLCPCVKIVKKMSVVIIKIIVTKYIYKIFQYFSL